MSGICRTVIVFLVFILDASGRDNNYVFPENICNPLIKKGQFSPVKLGQETLRKR